MPVTVATTTQTYWKDCWAPSSQVDLTLRSNGEEPVQVFTSARTLVPAGIDTPTVAATLADGGSTGGLPAGNYVYLYVYASSAYPSVEADTAAGGFQWPKGQPSPVSAVYPNTANHKINVTVGTSQRADIDKILIYRNKDISLSDLTYASIVGKAGQVFYVGFVQNNPAATTVTFTDTVLATAEELEVDNFSAPQFWKCCYIDPYWYGIGNPDLSVPVTIDAFGNLAATTNAFFSGRNGQLVTFDGIAKGGFDGNGTFYYLYNTLTVAHVSVSADLSTQDFPGYVTDPGTTTTMRVRGFAGTLYRSKARNPFAWAYTEYQTAGDSQVRVTQQFAQELGGYGVAIAVIPQNRQLKIDLERPARCYAIDVSVPLESNFQQATRLLDSRYIVTAQDSQFPCLVAGSGTALRGFDTSNFAIVQSDSSNQAPISDEVFQTLRTAVTANNAGRQFHGVYDAQTELSAFWFKQSNDPNNLITIDSCLLYHGPTGQWSFLRDLDVMSSISVYDPVALQNVTLIGTASGQICQAFVPGVFTNIDANPNPDNSGLLTIAALPTPTSYSVALPSFSRASNMGQYFDVYRDPLTIDRFWFSGTTSLGAPAVAPPIPDGGNLVSINVLNSTALLVRAAMRIAFTNAGYTSVIDSGGVVTATVPNLGPMPTPSSGTAPVTITVAYTPGSPELLCGQFMVDQTYGFFTDKANVWAMVYKPDGQSELYGRISPGFPGNNNIFQTNLWLNPDTLSLNQFPGTTLSIGQIVRTGLINCESQTYFQPSDIVSGTRIELWSTRENVDAQNQWARLYAEFDTGIYQTPFQLVQTKRGDNITPSDNWTTGSKVPSGLMTQFGIRLIERGYGNFTMLSFTLLGK